jgi:hypothetical protein
MIPPAGETFDVTCFAGINQYHTLRVEGECNPGQLSSCHIRCVDFEEQAMALAEVDSAESFSTATRSMFAQTMVYLASIHSAWRREKENHCRVAAAQAMLQCTRANLESVKVLEPDPSANIVMLVIDVVTDMRHIHLVKEAGGPSQTTKETEIKEQLLVAATDADHTDADQDELPNLAQSLARCRNKNAVGYDFLASCIAPLAEKCAALGKELHLILTGCSTINACPALLQAVPELSRKSVWVLCTSTVWPGDIAVFLWHLYGSCVQVGDLQIFRQRTRALLGEYSLPCTCCTSDSYPGAIR